MATSLAAQLQARQTVDGARLQSQRTLKQQPTFVFTPRHAASLTSADLHSLAANAWDQLAALDPFFAAHYKDVLGEQAKSLDRTGLTKEENEKVGKMVDKVLRALGKHMLLKPAGLVLEWLVRRFRCAMTSLGDCNDEIAAHGPPSAGCKTSTFRVSSPSSCPTTTRPTSRPP